MLLYYIKLKRKVFKLVFLSFFLLTALYQKLHIMQKEMTFLINYSKNIV